MGKRAGLHNNGHAPRQFHKSSHRREKAARLRSRRATASPKQCSRKQEKTSSYQATQAAKASGEQKRKSNLSGNNPLLDTFEWEKFLLMEVCAWERKVERKKSELMEGLRQNGLLLGRFNAQWRKNPVFQRAAMIQTLYAFELIMHPERNTCLLSSHSAQAAEIEGLEKFVAAVSTELRESQDNSVDLLSCSRVQHVWDPALFGRLLVHDVLDRTLPPALLLIFADPLKNKPTLDFSSLHDVGLDGIMESILPSMPLFLRGNADVMCRVMEVCGPNMTLRWSAKALQADRSFVLKVVRKDGMAVAHASEDMRSNLEVGITAVRATPPALAALSPSLRGCKKIVMAAVSQCGDMLMHASVALRNDAELVRRAALQNITALRFASQSLLCAPDFMLGLVRHCAEAYDFIGKVTLQHKLAARAVRLNHRVMERLSVSTRSERRVVLAYVLARKSDMIVPSLSDCTFFRDLDVADILFDRDFVVFQTVNLARLLKVNTGFSGRIKRHIMSFLCPTMMRSGERRKEEEYRSMLTRLSKKDTMAIRRAIPPPQKTCHRVLGSSSRRLGTSRMGVLWDLGWVDYLTLQELESLCWPVMDPLFSSYEHRILSAKKEFQSLPNLQIPPPPYRRMKDSRNLKTVFK